MAKEWAKEFYHSREWKELRGYVLKRDHYACVRCGGRGTEVHHIVRLTPANIMDRGVSLNPNNLELLCDACHKDEHFSERQRMKSDTRAKQEIKLDYVFDSNGNIVPPPPGSD